MTESTDHIQRVNEHGVVRILVARDLLWHTHRVNRLLHRCCVALGILAMALALFAIPATVSSALAKADMATAAEAMPCKGDCPDCPKPCPELGGCLLKCFNSLFAPPAQATLYGRDVGGFIALALLQRANDALVPPLLRPPSV
jgi:hypothetical protein